MIELTTEGTMLFLGFSFLMGACWGSFLNVCIYRIPRDESLSFPASHCPACDTPIHWYHNVPILSWLMLRGQCASCAAPIRPRYILVETLTGILFAVLFYQNGLSWLTLVYWLATFGLMLGTFVDFEYMIIPDRVTWGGMVLGLVLSPLVPSMHGETSAWLSLQDSALGAAVGFGLLYGVMVFGSWVFKKDAMGFGDVKLMGAVGAFLGWEAVLFTLTISSLLGSIVGLSLIAVKGREWQSRIPYGPYIAMAALIWIFGGSAGWVAYMRFITGGP